jgi:hypothetical protein
MSSLRTPSVSSRPVATRAIALALSIVVGWFSVEVVWEQAEGVAHSEVSGAAADADGDTDTGPCPCLCACACEAMPVVLPTADEPPVGSDVPIFLTYRVGPAPVSRSTEPPFRPPRVPS